MLAQSLRDGRLTGSAGTNQDYAHACLVTGHGWAMILPKRDRSAPAVA
jgi:hypothetical protein